MEETADAHSVSFAVPEGAEAEFDYKPGQFLTLAVPSDQTGVAARCYSLSSSPHDGGPLTVTVKRTVDGYASNWICDNLREGSTIRSLPPRGSSRRPTWTPTCCCSPAAAASPRSCRSPGPRSPTAAAGSCSSTPTRRAVGDLRLRAGGAGRRAPAPAGRRALAGVVQGLPTQEQMKAFTEPFATYDAFVCGPAPFMKLTIAALRELEFPRERRHQEKFISLGGNPFGDPEEQAKAEHELEEADSDADFTRVPSPSSTSRPRARPRATSGSRSSSTARPTPTTTGRRPPSCSSTWSRRA